MIDLPKLPVTLIIDDEEIVLNYEKELELSEETINIDLKDQPSYFAWYAVLHEKAVVGLGKARMVLEMLEASLAVDIREECLITGQKPTEKYIREQIIVKESYQTAAMAVIDAQKNVGILKGIKDAFIHRKDMLITFASNLRAQMDANVYLKKDEIKSKD